MKNRFMWMGLAALALALIGVFAYVNLRSRALSPRGTETLTTGGITVTVTYNRPSVRGRLIFGRKEQNALQPFGEYWRLGANEATEISLSRDVVFNGSAISAGTYRMYAIPDASAFELVLNTQTGESGSTAPDPANDVLRTKVETQKTAVPVEQFTISLAPEDNGMQMVFEWSDTRFAVPIRPAQ